MPYTEALRTFYSCPYNHPCSCRETPDSSTRMHRWIGEPGEAIRAHDRARLEYQSRTYTTTMQFQVITLIALLGAVASASPASALFAKRSITCLTVGQTATATWKNAAGKTCKWTGIVGSNFGTNSVNGGEYVDGFFSLAVIASFDWLTYPTHAHYDRYSCNGRCGAGCTGAALGNAYTQDCFSHDICSWFNNASGGARYVDNAWFVPTTDNHSDANCGAAFNAAVDDTLGGLVAGCSRTNPSNAASKPSTQPVCS